MNKDLLNHTISNFENYLTETDCFLNILTDICDNADLTDKTAAKIVFLCDIFKEKNLKTWDLLKYN